MDDIRETSDELPGNHIRKFKVYDKDMTVVEGDLSAHPILNRIKEYDLRQQLNCLFDDIEAGLFGEDAKTGKFASYIKSIKEQFPKN